MKQNDRNKQPRKGERREVALELRETEEQDGYISQDEVIELLYNIEYHRNAIANVTDKFEYWLGSSKQLRDVWNRFLIGGGISANDFQAFLNGKFRCRPVRQRRHLRLISNNSYKPSFSVRGTHGDDAA